MVVQPLWVITVVGRDEESNVGLPKKSIHRGCCRTQSQAKSVGEISLLFHSSSIGVCRIVTVCGRSDLPVWENMSYKYHHRETFRGERQAAVKKKKTVCQEWKRCSDSSLTVNRAVLPASWKSFSFPFRRWPSANIHRRSLNSLYRCIGRTSSVTGKHMVSGLGMQRELPDLVRRHAPRESSIDVAQDRHG